MNLELRNKTENSLINKYGMTLVNALPKLNDESFIKLFKYEYDSVSSNSGYAMILNPEAYVLNEDEVKKLRNEIEKSIINKLYNRGYMSEGGSSIRCKTSQS